MVHDGENPACAGQRVRCHGPPSHCLCCIIPPGVLVFFCPARNGFPRTGVRYPWGYQRVEVVMATKELTGENFGEVVGGADMVLIDFWAAWCGPCRFFAPVYERVSQRHGDIVFGKVDTEAQSEL